MLGSVRHSAMNQIKADDMKRFYKLAGVYVLVAAVIFVLQWFPFPGIYLMMLMGPFWMSALEQLRGQPKQP